MHPLDKKLVNHLAGVRYSFQRVLHGAHPTNSLLRLMGQVDPMYNLYRGIKRGLERRTW